MNKDIMKKAGFDKEVEHVSHRRCPFCHIDIDPLAFRDDISRKEFNISGLCQTCQDKTFGGGDDNEPV